MLTYIYIIYMFNHIHSTSLYLLCIYIYSIFVCFYIRSYTVRIYVSLTHQKMNKQLEWPPSLGLACGWAPNSQRVERFQLIDLRMTPAAEFRFRFRR